MTVDTLTSDIRLRDQLADARNAPLRALHAYWASKRTDGRLPGRRDIDPSEIPQLLPALFLVDISAGPPRRFRFRLVGTQIVFLEGEITGKYLDEIMRIDLAADIVRHYEDACRGVAYVCDRSLEWQNRDHVDYSVLLLPLADDGVTVDRLVGYALYRNL
jgi:hypothetical protein